jgi:hypothetical protein
LSIRRKGGSGDISGFPFIAGVLGYVIDSEIMSLGLKPKSFLLGISDAVCGFDMEC